MKKFLTWIRNNLEWFFFPLGIVIWWVLIPVFRFFDPTTGIYDLAVWQKLIFAAVGLFFGVGMTFLIIWMKTPKGYKLLDALWTTKLVSTSPEHRSWLILVFFSVLLLSFVLLVNAL